MRITSRQLRQIIREELVREDEQRPGSPMRRSKVISAKSQATAELTKTHDWFKNTVFPAIENNTWPVVADQDYVGYLTFFAEEDPAKNEENWANFVLKDEQMLIKKGTTFNSVDDKQPVYQGKPAAIVPQSLADVYSQLDNVVVDLKLSVPMESFPDYT